MSRDIVTDHVNSIQSTKYIKMKISYNWLKQYLDISLDDNQVADILTSIGLEVEGIEEFQSIKGGLEGMLVGEVKTCEPHPNADKLSVTTVDVGADNLLNIVCGAPNVAAGQKVVVATIGSTLYKGNEPFPIKKTKIRGLASEGMICSEDELGLSTERSEGIIVLPQDIQVGTPASDYFKVENDTVFEIGLTPNRSDAVSHIGVARDLAAYLKQEHDVELQLPSVEHFAIDNTSHPVEVIVENQEACPRYCGLTIKGFKVGESPNRLKNRLKAIGMNPINNVVDITNYILHTTGQALHAFDLEKVKGNKIVVKTLEDKSKFTSLDKQERELRDKDLMICNESEGMCIAGVLGGIDSGISEKSTGLFLECAYFNPVWIRKTAKHYGIKTDSSFRFERGADPNATIRVLKLAALMIKDIAGGEITSEIVDIYPKPIENFKVLLKYKNIDRLVGNHIPAEKVKKILRALEINILEENKESLQLEVPTYRVDVSREADVIEEILRIYGYNNVTFPENLRTNLSFVQKPDIDKIRNAISDYLSSLGLNEIMSNSLTKASYYQKLKSYKAENCVMIMNALSSDLNAMRQSLLFGGLECIAYNANRKNANLALYEFGNCYTYDNSKPQKDPLQKYSEANHLALFLCGTQHAESWNRKEQATDFYQIKQYVENILKKMGFALQKFAKQEISNEMFEYGLSYTLSKKTIVRFGAVNQKLQEEFDIKTEVFFAEFNWNNLIENYKDELQYQEISKFQPVRRDLALLINSDIRFEQLEDLAYKTEKKILKEVSIFDVYQGKNIEAGKKSYALSFILQDEKKTLTDKQIDKVVKRLIRAFETKFDAQIR